MEKFHKYCLSVLLVIICSNISAQVNNATVENEDCRQLYELYHQILNHEGNCSQKLCDKENPEYHFTISQKQNAGLLIGKIFSGKTYSHFSKNSSGTDFSEKERHDRLLKNFEKSSKETLFAEISYFKIKVSKVRNKDYLSAVG